jgi:hypothetical protein
MAFSQTQLDAIESGIASGQLHVAYDGKSVTFRSLDDMLRVRALIMGALGLKTTPQTLIAAHDRGTRGPMYDGSYAGSGALPFRWGGP